MPRTKFARLTPNRSMTKSLTSRISSLICNSQRTNAAGDGTPATTPEPKSRKSHGFSLATFGLKGRSGKSSATQSNANASSSPLPPRSSLKPEDWRDPKALRDNSLLMLMRQEKRNEFTEGKFQRLNAMKEKKSQGFEEATAQRTDDPKPTKTVSNHKTVDMGSVSARRTGAEERIRTQRQSNIEKAATELMKLVNDHPGKFDADIDKGVLPKKARVRGLDESDHLDAIQAFKQLRRSEHKGLIFKVANELDSLGLTVDKADDIVEKAKEMYPDIFQNTGTYPDIFQGPSASVPQPGGMDAEAMLQALSKFDDEGETSEITVAQDSPTHAIADGTSGTVAQAILNSLAADGSADEITEEDVRMVLNAFAKVPEQLHDDVNIMLADQQQGAKASYYKENIKSVLADLNQKKPT
jgi:hypothetical protein